MNFKKILLTFILSISLFLSMNMEHVGAATADTLVVHYYRYDEAISDYELWLWPSDGDGSTYSFNATDGYGAVATVSLVGTNLTGSDTIGIIAKTALWEKDIEINRFIDMTNPNVAGEVHVYLLQAEEFISYVSSDSVSCDRLVFNDPLECAQVVGEKLIDVFFNDSLNVEFSTTISVNSSDIHVLKEGVPVSFTGFTSGTNGELNLNQTVDVTKKYEIQVDLGSESVTYVIRVGDSYDSAIFQSAYNYDGDLGAIYSPTETTFNLWAPLSSEVELNIYSAGHTISTRADGDDTPVVHSMTYLEKGVWQVILPGDLHGVYYTFNVVNSGSQVTDIQDPYSLSLGVNGLRSMVVNFDEINPESWNTDSGVDGYTSANDSIIYELHVRDLTSQDAWGGPIEYAKTYMGFTVTGTSFTNTNNGITVSTGLDHLIELGITHVHLLPTYDQGNWNDERNMDFNWGYNPDNYNSPEGGYSTDPYDGSVRITEYQEMVMALHNNGINVIQDVVYNHTGLGANYSFNRIVPNYFYRLNSDGSYSNGSGVSNETASERYMVRKYIVDSVSMWATEYHIDGFRFDLMAVHDVTTMNLLSSKLELIDPDIFVYGEPWGGGNIALAYNLQAGKNNITSMPSISAFNDQFRDAIKGSTWNGSDPGYVTDSDGIYDIMKGIEGSVNWGWGLTSTQSINYVSAHDNLTLYDKLKEATGSTGYTTEIDYQARLSNSIVMFSQGIPFLHAGVDFLRTKGGNENSYDSSDTVNQLNWVRKSIYNDSFEYYKGIIEIRKNYDSFKMTSETDIEANLSFLYPPGNGMIGYNLTKNNEEILIYHNGGENINTISLPTGAWMLISDRDYAGLDSLGTYDETYPIEKAETLVFVKGEFDNVITSPVHEEDVTLPEITNLFGVVFVGASFNLTSDTNISYYSINNGVTFTLVNPSSSSVLLEELDDGVYHIMIKNSYGDISEVFVLTVLEQTMIDITAPVITLSSAPKLEVGDSEPDWTMYGSTNEGTLVIISNEIDMSTSGTYSVIYSATDDTGNITIEALEVVVSAVEAIDNIVDEDDDNTGCFGAIKSSTVITFVGIVILGGAALILVRKP